jgi:hypothetical protein
VACPKSGVRGPGSRWTAKRLITTTPVSYRQYRYDTTYYSASGRRHRTQDTVGFGFQNRTTPTPWRYRIRMIIVPFRSTHLEQAIPAPRAERNSIPADTETRDPVIVSREHTDSLALERVPDVTVVVVVSGKQDPSRGGECDRGNTAEDVVVGVRVEFAIGPEIEELARGVVGSGRKRIAIGEEPGGVVLALAQ